MYWYFSTHHIMYHYVTRWAKKMRAPLNQSRKIWTIITDTVPVLPRLSQVIARSGDGNQNVICLAPTLLRNGFNRKLSRCDHPNSTNYTLLPSSPSYGQVLALKSHYLQTTTDTTICGSTRNSERPWDHQREDDGKHRKRFFSDGQRDHLILWCIYFTHSKNSIL